MSRPLLILAALAAGSLNAIEAATNTALRKGLDAPLWSVAAIAAATLALAVASALATGEAFPDGGAFGAVPWWGWLGGALGFGFVVAMIYLAGPLGAGLFIALTVTASIAASVALDHFGLLGLAPHAAGLGRLAGAALMVAGVALIAAF